MIRAALGVLMLMILPNVVWAEETELRIPGMVIDLKYSRNQLPPMAEGLGLTKWVGGDIGQSGPGFAWLEVQQDGSHSFHWQKKRLPAGIIIALKHSLTQAKAPIYAFNRDDPVDGPMKIPGFERRHGGDFGAPPGMGYYWYESVAEGSPDWSLISRLPIGTVVGLRHDRNQPHKPVSSGGMIGQDGVSTSLGAIGKGAQWAVSGFMWGGGFECRDKKMEVVHCDPRMLSVQPPQGFIRVVGGDAKAPSGSQGFVWYEKRTEAGYPKVGGAMPRPKTAIGGVAAAVVPGKVGGATPKPQSPVGPGADPVGPPKVGGTMPAPGGPKPDPVITALPPQGTPIPPPKKMLPMTPTYEFMGCYTDAGDPVGLNGRDLSGHVVNEPTMTVERCTSVCAEKKFAYAGVQYGSWCFCGNNYGRRGQSKACNMPCGGNAKQICGGNWANSVYRLK